MRDDRLNQIESEIQHLENLKKQLRTREKSIRGREAYLAQPEQFKFNAVKSLKEDLQANLAPHMMPANVGGLNEVAWPFFFQINFDLGVNPVISEALRQTRSFQVDQEACFLLMSISRSHSTSAAGLSATANAPLAVDLIDRQSSRRFSSNLLPIQMFGSNSTPTILPTSMLIMPNAFLDVTVSGIPTVVGAQTFTGSGAFQMSFFGYRTRVENAEKVLSTIFG